MKSKLLILFLLVFSGFTLLAQTKVTIKAPSDVTVRFDNKVKADNDGDGVIIIEDVIAGEHRLYFERVNCRPILRKIDVSGKVFEYEISTGDFDCDPVMDEVIDEIVDDGGMDEAVFYIVDKMPLFQPEINKTKEESDLAVQKFIQQNIKYPKVAYKKRIQGRVYVSFTVDTNGKVVDVKILRGVDPLLDGEAKRVIESLPDFKPGEQSGKAVKVAYNIPIGFKLGPH